MLILFIIFLTILIYLIDIYTSNKRYDKVFKDDDSSKMYPSRPPGGGGDDSDLIDMYSIPGVDEVIKKKK